MERSDYWGFADLPECQEKVGRALGLRNPEHRQRQRYSETALNETEFWMER